MWFLCGDADTPPVPCKSVASRHCLNDDSQFRRKAESRKSIAPKTMWFLYGDADTPPVPCKSVPCKSVGSSHCLNGDSQFRRKAESRNHIAPKTMWFLYGDADTMPTRRQSHASRWVVVIPQKCGIQRAASLLRHGLQFLVAARFADLQSAYPINAVRHSCTERPSRRTALTAFSTQDNVLLNA